MKFRILLAGLGLAWFAPFALGQTIPNPITSAVRMVMHNSARNMIASAKLMPAGKYGYKPTPPQMTFRHLIKHATMANYFFCSRLTGAAMPKAAHGVMAGRPAKAVLIKRLRASYAYCQARFAHATDQGLGKPVHLFGPHSMSRGGGMIMMANDWTDHYAIAAYYLRLNGILPPTARRHH